MVVFGERDGRSVCLLWDQIIAVLAVLDGPAEGGELVAQDIGLTPVLGLAHSEALFGEGADLSGDFDFFFRSEDRKNQTQRAEDAVEGREGLGGSESFQLRRLAQSGKNGTEGAGGVEVVIERIPCGLEGAELDAREHGIGGGFGGELLGRLCHFRESFARRVEAIEREIERFAIVTTDEHIAHFHRRPTVLGEVFESVEIAERLRHFATIDHQMGDMEPSRSEVSAAGAAALGDFIFVVRENQIDTATVQVEGIAEVFTDHRRTFEVPARTAFSPGRTPKIFAILGASGFPQDKVADALLFILIGIRALRLRASEFQFAFVEVREFAVFRKRGDVKIDRAIVRSVSVAFLDELGNHIDLLRNVLHRARFNVRRETLEEIAVVMKLLRPAGCEIAQRLAESLRFADCFVIHIRQIADMERASAARFQSATEDILQYKSAEIANVGGAIDRGTAAIKPESLAIDRRQILDFSC